MKAIIAEKPSVAREIAQVLNVQKRAEGYFIGNGYCITWAFCHLLELGMPEDYGIAGFYKANLPIFPSPFKLVPRTIKNAKGSQQDPLALQQLKVIQQVIEQCESIIVATDAGREGELIFRYIYHYLQCKKPFERLWISSLTEKAISAGFKNLKPGSIFDALYLAAKARSEADWLIGINASQALTIAGEETYSLGRVQTPTLALVCKRFLEHQQFQKQKYYQIQLKHRKDYLDFFSISAEQWQDRKYTEKIMSAIEREGRAVVEDVQTKTVKELSPLLYNLTALQKEANRRLGLTADEVLQIAQSLYEKKFITYPRTGSQYIPEDLWTETPELVRALTDDHQFKQAASYLKFGNFNKRIVNDLKVTDHHGLLTTYKIPSALSVREKAVYKLIAYRLLESLAESCIKEVSHVILKVHHYEFIIKGADIVDKGWRSIKGLLSENDDDQENLMNLPTCNVGDILKISSVELKERITQAPKLYSEADLLSAMENAGNLTTTDEHKYILQDIGIGTPATRASIIETLLKRNYVIRNNKTLMPTDKGLKIYNLTKGKQISDVQMTAEWELAFHQIEQGQLNVDKFLNNIQTYTTEITKELLASPIQRENIPQLQCPKCRQQYLIIRDKIIKCPDEDCSWFQYRNVCGVQLNIEQIISLIKNRKTPIIKNMKARNGKNFSAFIVLKDDYKTIFEFLDP